MPDFLIYAQDGPLVTYLQAAANGFRTNRWGPADEAWSRMNAENSTWYVRVGPDEVYTDPCAHKAAFQAMYPVADMDVTVHAPVDTSIGPRRFQSTVKMKPRKKNSSTSGATTQIRRK